MARVAGAGGGVYVTKVYADGDDLKVDVMNTTSVDVDLLFVYTEGLSV